jgi:hypothetical protein
MAVLLFNVIQRLEISPGQFKHVDELVHVVLADRVVRYGKIINDDQTQLIFWSRFRRCFWVLRDSVQGVEDSLSSLRFAYSQG